MLPVLSAEELKKWDDYTIQKHYDSSWQLMEKASRIASDWILKNCNQDYFLIVCGKGNNGGDGLAIARMLLQDGKKVNVFLTTSSSQLSPDALENYHNLISVDKHIFIENKELEEINYDKNNWVIVDAIFGYGFKGDLPLEIDSLISLLNKKMATKIAIDLPSGLSSEPVEVLPQLNCFQADLTLTFQTYKMSLLLPEYSCFYGKVFVLDIGLYKQFLSKKSYEAYSIEKEDFQRYFKIRNDNTHKGDFGKAAIVAGSKGMMGASILATHSCMRMGAGLTTAIIPNIGYDIMQISAPEAMCITQGSDYLAMDGMEESNTAFIDKLNKFDCLGIGPGMGQLPETQNFLEYIITNFNKQIVLDADGLNSLSLLENGIELLNYRFIITPHPKEFDRLFGLHSSTLSRIKTAQEFTLNKNCVIILKSHNTIIIEKGKLYFNTSGNAALSKGGSGDVLLGMITGMLAQKYNPLEASILSVFIHGIIAEEITNSTSKNSVLASDIINNIGSTIFKLSNLKKPYTPS